MPEGVRSMEGLEGTLYLTHELANDARRLGGCCLQQEVRCVELHDVRAWLELQDQLCCRGGDYLVASGLKVQRGHSGGAKLSRDVNGEH